PEKLVAQSPDRLDDAVRSIDTPAAPDVVNCVDDYARKEYPGKSVAELARVVVVGRLRSPYTVDGHTYTHGHPLGGTGSIIYADGSVAVSCLFGSYDQVIFV